MLIGSRARRGFTLPELVIALVCAGALFAVVGSIGLRQQRLFSELADNAAMTNRLREAIATLPIDLRAVSPRAGDIRDARDTSLEIRATIASAVVCDTAGRSLVLGPAGQGTATYAAYLSPIATGDTAWVLDAGAVDENWIPRRITSVTSRMLTKCAAGGPLLRPGSFAALVVALDTLSPASVGAVLRVTRPVRYSLYRSSDGSWQLGARDWNATTQRLNAIQPVAGALLSPSGRGLIFSYFDTSGAELPRPVTMSAGIALVRIVARTQGQAPSRVLGTTSGPAADSLASAVFLRNRR